MKDIKRQNYRGDSKTWGGQKAAKIHEELLISSSCYVTLFSGVSCQIFCLVINK